MQAFNTPSSRWQAVVARDPTADGHFVYCVRTTGIYCRPICKARCARRANVEFHINASAAEAAGFRACKRCQPHLLSYTPEIDKIAKAIEAIGGLTPDQPLPSLEYLARCAGLTKHHFHRSFKRAIGVTPREYLLLRRNTASSSDVHQASSMESSSVSTPWSLPGGLDGTYTPEAQGGSGEETITDWLNVLGQGPNTRASPEYPDGFKLDARRSVSVYYAIRQTTLGLLSIAFVNGHVCKLELCDSVSDAIIELEGRFAPPAFALVCLDGIHSGIVEKLAALNIRADELVEAMERPSGRMVYIPQALSGAPFALEV